MEQLYNGIILDEDWLKKAVAPSGIPEEIPYLQNPPAVIDVTVGRQLFVDSFLIEETDLEPTYHKAKKHPANPIFFAETSHEKYDTLPLACPKSGGVWWDDRTECYRMWYDAGWVNRLAYAESKDGIHWVRPQLNLETGDNLLLCEQDTLSIQCPNGDQVLLPVSELRTDSSSVWIDPTADPAQRYKMFFRPPTRPPEGNLYDPAIVGTSADGIHWENLRYTPNIGDRSTMFYNPFRKKWVFSIRDYWNSRSRLYRECDDLLEGASWKLEEAVRWLSADRLDVENPFSDSPISLYNTDVIAYESILLGMFEAWYGPDNKECLKTGKPKHTGLMPMYSRDGFHFCRPNRELLIQEDADSWDRGYIQSVTGGVIIHDDEIWLYYVGFRGDESIITDSEFTNGMYANGATGIAVLRRDGFVSMGSPTGGFLLTRLLTVQNAAYMFVNLDGSLSVEILTEDGNVYTSQTLRCNSAKQQVIFDSFHLTELNGTTFRIRFCMKEGQLYSFWFSDSKDGRSGGYCAAGMPPVK